jgi:RNA polymerase sigma factor for flagellar operon FliA
MSLDVDAAYALYATGDGSRNAVVVAALGMIRYQARRDAARCGGAVDADDLAQAAAVGLLAAVDNYDPTRGLTFADYARCKIRHAIQDCMRDADVLARVSRHQAKVCQSAAERLRQEHHREPTEEEVLDEVDVPRRRRRWWLGSTRAAPPGELLAEPAAPAMHADLDLQDAVSRLPAHERVVVEMHGLQGWSQREVAGHLGVAAPTISYRWRQACAKLRGMLDAA